jgi:hypothetical protein
MEQCLVQQRVQAHHALRFQLKQGQMIYLSSKNLSFKKKRSKGFAFFNDLMFHSSIILVKGFLSWILIN